MIKEFQKDLMNVSLSFVLMLGLCACGTGYSALLAVDENGTETANLVEERDGYTPQESQTVGVGTSQRMILNQAMALRAEVSGVLESQSEVPAGTQIEVPTNYSTKNLDYRDSSGNLVRSSTGFIFPIKIVSVPVNFQGQFPSAKIENLNSVNGGLFIFASIVGELQGLDGHFSIISQGVTGDGFLKHYDVSGKPKFSYTNSINKRFASRLNKGVDMQSLSSVEAQKWQRIYTELKKASDRTVETAKSYLMVDSATAKKASLNFEAKGLVPSNGAWSIAVGQTAVRHGFANVPCAEFQSELVREAYQRAGYRVTEDFNTTKGNHLLWSNTASVVNFSMALYKAGWVPWDSKFYRPMKGAVLMNGSGVSPGHTYISANDDGTIIVDNGAPQGRDLKKTSASIIGMMFQTGVFFLPPGINPSLW